MSDSMSVSDSSKKSTSGDVAVSFGGTYSGGGSAIADTGFMAQFWAANPGTGASAITQSIASIPTMGWIAIGASLLVIGFVLIKRR